MSGRNGIQLAQQQPQMVIAAPLNDNQLIALVAAKAPPGTPVSEAVAHAVDLIVESVVQGQHLAARVQKRMREEALKT